MKTDRGDVDHVIELCIRIDKLCLSKNLRKIKTPCLMEFRRSAWIWAGKAQDELFRRAEIDSAKKAINNKENERV